VKFEATIDYIQGIGNRYLSSEGHVVELDGRLEKELLSVGVLPKFFIEGLVDFITENKQNIYSFFVPARSIVGECKNILKIFELWISSYNSLIKLIVIIINIEENAQILLFKPELYVTVSHDIMSTLTQKYLCVEIIMPFIYRFVIFDTFNIFKKLFNIVFEGIIDLKGNKYMTSISNDERALIWKIDSTNMKYLSNNLIPSELLRLVR